MIPSYLPSIFVPIVCLFLPLLAMAITFIIIEQENS